MADASRSTHPSGWNDAFAACLLEAPPASAWPAIAAQLHRRAQRTRHLTWLALAASLSAIVALPLVWQLRDTAGGNAPAPTPVTAAAHSSGKSASPSISPDASDTAIDQTSPDAIATRAPSAETRPAATAAAPPVRAAEAPRRHRRERPAASGHALATTDGDQSPSTDANADLEALYAASAQLETLLALTRDTRAESGPAAALASALDAALATIDARLAEPGLDTSQQEALWQARVDTLRQATDFETQQRVLSAQGRRYEGALVRID